MGKLMILKLRADYQARAGTSDLQAFHDKFLGVGPLPIPLVRKAMGLSGGPF
jgi:uncharacterized protein (DUF885 family)